MIRQREFIDKDDHCFTWNNNWIHPFESPWGVIEKIKHANFISTNEFLRVFGNEKVKKIKGKIGDSHRNLLTLEGINEEIFNSEFGFPIKRKNKSVLEKLFQGFYNFEDNPNFYFRKELWFCKICLSKGFHSTIFQCKLINHCPFHGQPLINGCPRCKVSIPYRLTDEYTENPYICKCGELWLSSKNQGRPISSWTDTKISPIQSEKLIKWINLNEEQISLLKRVRFFKGFDLGNINNGLDNLLSIVDNNFEKNKVEIHHNIKSSKNINILKINISSDYIDNKRSSNKKYDNEKVDSWLLLRNSQKYKEFNDHIYESSRKTVSSIARKIRKTIYPEHKTCVKRLVKLLKEKDSPFPPFCPYAYAYVYWKKSVEGIEQTHKVDHYGYPHRRVIDGVDIASNQDRDFIHPFIDDWIDFYEEIPKKQLVGLKWILDRMVSILIMNHYENWLRIAPEYASKRIEANFDQHIYRNLPFFIFVLPTKESEPIEIHWWNKKGNNGCKRTMNCPFPTLSQKRIRPSEYSHTPQRLTIDKLNERWIRNNNS